MDDDCNIKMSNKQRGRPALIIDREIVDKLRIQGFSFFLHFSLITP